MSQASQLRTSPRGAASGGQPQAATAAGKLTRTGGFFASEATAAPSASGVRGLPSAHATGGGGEAPFLDPYLDMVSLGLAAPTSQSGTGGSAGGAPVQQQAPAETSAPEAAAQQQPRGGHPVPLDVFLRVQVDTRLMRQPTATAAGVGGAELQPTTVVLAAEDIVRAATPAAPAAHPGYRYVCNAAELFGWIPEGSVVELETAPLAVRGAEGLDEEVPDDAAMPELGADDYANLLLLEQDAAVYQQPGPHVTVLATALRMESVVKLGDEREMDGARWLQVRLVRTPPITGWLRDAEGSAVAQQAVTRALTGVPPLSLAAQSTGPAVLELEQLLVTRGHHPGPADATFDQTTHDAVLAFQLAAQITQDGIVGPETVEALFGEDRRYTSPMNVTTGTWVSGFELRGPTPGIATTPDGEASAAGYSSAAQGAGSMMAAGPCEVLHRDGQPAVYDAGDGPRRYARGADGGAGWVLEQSLLQINGEDGAPVAGAETGLAEELASLCPNGITVAFVTQFSERQGRSFDTFLREGSAFAADHLAVAVSGGELVTGTVNLITHKNQVVSLLSTIQQALRGGAAELPAWARVAHLAFFTHGSYTDDLNEDGTIEDRYSYGGLQTDGDNWDEDGNLRAADLPGFARTLTAYTTSDVEVSLFACSTGMEDLGATDLTAKAQNYRNWLPQESLTGGETSFADVMADSLVAAGAEDAMVMGHTTIGHTVLNPAARLFTGGEDGGVNIFNWLFLPLHGWLATELGDVRRSEITRDAVAYLERELFAWFRDVYIRDSSETTSHMSTDPELYKVETREAARAWLHEQYTSWGVITAEMAASRRTVLDGSGMRPVNYPYATRPPAPVEIAAGTEIEVRGRAESINGIESYPVTWAGDPYPPGTEGAIQAYLPVNWLVDRFDGS